MDTVLYKCITEGDHARLKEILSEDLLFKEETCMGDTALHVAVQYESKNFVEEFFNTCPALVLRQNVKGDSPLHMAAREGLTDIVKVLLRYAGPRITDVESGSVIEHPKQSLLTMSNNEMNSALHEAVRNNHVWVVKLLVEADVGFHYVANKSGKTPLYLAVEHASPNVVKRILENMPNSAHDGPNGTTALHAAVIRNDIDITTLLLEKNNRNWKKQVDEKGRTALHYSIMKSKDDMTSLLLIFDKGIGYEADNDGSTALHLAASKGKVEAINEILYHCPDSWGILNKRGQNFLHVAVESEKTEVIKHAFQITPQIIKCLVNEQDNNGNTPFHLAAKKSTIVDIFKNDDKVKKTIQNKENLTPMDLVSKTEEVQGNTGAEENNPWVESDPNIQFVRDSLQTSLIIATLVATVTFAAALQLPGGYTDDGKAILSDNPYFQIFLIINCFILLCSIFSATMLYLVRFQKERSKIFRYCNHGNFAANVALGFLPSNFALSCYAVLPPSILAVRIIYCLTSIYGFVVIIRFVLLPIWRWLRKYRVARQAH